MNCVPCRLGENWAKNLLFSWAVLQVKSPILAHVHPWSLEGGCAWSRNSDYSLSSLVSRKMQVKYTLFVGFAQLSGQEGPSLTQDSTGLLFLMSESTTMPVATSRHYRCFTASDDENGVKLSALFCSLVLVTKNQTTLSMSFIDVSIA